jgi:hypothetical protein
MEGVGVLGFASEHDVNVSIYSGVLSLPRPWLKEGEEFLHQFMAQIGGPLEGDLYLKPQ